MKRKLLTMALSVVMLIASISRPTFANNDAISVYLNGKQLQFDVQPQIINDRTMVPLRAIFEALGASVHWDDNTKTVTSSKNTTNIILTVDRTTMSVNGNSVALDSPACIVDGRTLVPVRAISEAYNTFVDWSEKNKSVVICSKDVYAYKDYPDIPDLGKCYNIPLVSEKDIDGYKIYSYIYKDMSNDDYYSYIYDNSALVLGDYAEETATYSDGNLYIKYTKKGETEPTYYVSASYDSSGAMLFDVRIPNSNTSNVEVVTTIMSTQDFDNGMAKGIEYFNNGLYYEARDEFQWFCDANWGNMNSEQQKYALDYLNRAKGKIVEIQKKEAEASSNQQSSSQISSNPIRTGVYRTPKGKKYHFSAACGGKNSYATTLEAAKSAGLTPCSKCAN
ncbi:MAG: copper amine oxidase N-terminal domain-containing protein [Clostridia bacterium]|nr:copper amine oxidase N-terminal domain-containing protein [Clostridia bacterium]